MRRPRLGSAGATASPGPLGPPALNHLAITFDMVASRQYLEAVGAGLELPDRTRRDSHRVQGTQLDDLVVDLDPPAARKDHVQLFDRLVAVPEANPFAGPHPVERRADRLGTDVLAQIASFPGLLQPVSGVHVFDLVEVDPRGGVVHDRARYAESGPALLNKRVSMTRRDGRIEAWSSGPPARAGSSGPTPAAPGSILSGIRRPTTWPTSSHGT